MKNNDLYKHMAGLLNGLTEEQKEKAKACKTSNELMSFLSEIGVALPDEFLDAVAGGGQKEDLEFISKLTLWDDVCQQRGIDVHDGIRREQVWRELFPLG